MLAKVHLAEQARLLDEIAVGGEREGVKTRVKRSFQVAAVDLRELVCVLLIHLIEKECLLATEVR